MEDCLPPGYGDKYYYIVISSDPLSPKYRLIHLESSVLDETLGILVIDLFTRIWSLSDFNTRTLGVNNLDLIIIYCA